MSEGERIERLRCQVKLMRDIIKTLEWIIVSITKGKFKLPSLPDFVNEEY